jgi:hypothetical protein
MTVYKYKKPRSFNLVTVFLILGLLAIAYGAWKFIPPYWKGYKVDSVLAEAKLEASDLPLLSDEQRRNQELKISQRVYVQLRDLGVGDTQGQPVEVGFGPNYSYIYARYDIIVHHPFGKTTRMKFRRKVSIPSNKHL